MHNQHLYAKNDITLETVADTLADTTIMAQNLKELGHDYRVAALITKHYRELVNTTLPDERRNITRGILAAHSYTLTGLLQEYRRPEDGNINTYLMLGNSQVVYYNLPLILAIMVHRHGSFPLHIN